MDFKESNKDKKWVTLHGDFIASKKRRYKVGDIVRVEKYNSDTRFVNGDTITQDHPVMLSMQDIESGKNIWKVFQEIYSNESEEKDEEQQEFVSDHPPAHK